MATTKRAPAMRVQCRLVVLDVRGEPAQTLEEFHLDYQGIEYGTLAYQWIRRYFRRQRKDGKNTKAAVTFENRLDKRYKRGENLHPPRCQELMIVTNTFCGFEMPCPRHENRDG